MTRVTTLSLVIGLICLARLYSGCRAKQRTTGPVAKRHVER